MKTTVVICSVNRPDVLSETIESVLQGQSTPPREIIVSVCNREHVPERILAEASVRVVVSARQGLTVQRNTGAKLVRTPYTLFLDDDVEIAPNFIESMERLLDEVQDAVAATGFLVADGVKWDTGLNRESARTAALGYVQGRDNYDRDELYGCNLFVRTDILNRVLFDERLALYGWLEDLDFTTNCLRFGRTIVNAETCVAHLATPGGRISGPKLGYSQIVNPFYLWRKNGKPGLSHVVVAHWFVFVARNIFRALAKIPSGRGDRKGRFRGNVIGMWHLMRGKVDPSYILQLEDTASAESRSSSVAVQVLGRPTR